VTVTVIVMWREHAPTTVSRTIGTTVKETEVATRGAMIGAESAAATESESETGTDTEVATGMSRASRAVSAGGGTLSCLLVLLTENASRVGGRIVRLLKEF
jgi:hypothetical protein